MCGGEGGGAQGFLLLRASSSVNPALVISIHLTKILFSGSQRFWTFQPFTRSCLSHVTKRRERGRERGREGREGGRERERERERGELTRNV